MSDLYQKLETCLASVRKRTDFKPEVALILGSGLGDYADEIQLSLIHISEPTRRS